MACANTKCGHKFWCPVNSTECLDVQECEEARIIAIWWSDVKSGRRDRAKGITDDEIPFADEDNFTTADLEED